MLEPVCGPCVGIGQAPLQGAPSLRTFKRNFPGAAGLPRTTSIFAHLPPPPPALWLVGSPIRGTPILCNFALLQSLISQSTRRTEQHRLRMRSVARS